MAGLNSPSEMSQTFGHNASAATPNEPLRVNLECLIN